MAIFKAKCQSFGVRSRFWEKGELLNDVTMAEFNKHAEIKAYFEPVDDHARGLSLPVNSPKQETAQESVTPIADSGLVDIDINAVVNDSKPTLEEISAQYEKKFDRKVPNNKALDYEWLSKKVLEA